MNTLAEVLPFFWIIKQLAEIFSQCFVLKKTVDKVKNIYTTFIPILLWHLRKLKTDFVNELLILFPLFSFKNISNKSGTPAKKRKNQI
jgi:carbon starvation protein CstA